MNFSHVLHAVIGLLVIEGRLSYRRLQTEFDLDDTQLEALRFELTEVKRLAICDLADSTALSARLDPEDLQDVIRAYQERCTAIVREYEGFVAKYMGDGILVYFGYPKSLERNAERAVRSGLAHLWRDQGKPEAARELLAPIHDWFTEGFETADLMDAKALLDELAPSAMAEAVG